MAAVEVHRGIACINANIIGVHVELALVLACALTVDAEGVSVCFDTVVPHRTALRAYVHHGTVLEDEVSVAIHRDVAVEGDIAVGHIPAVGEAGVGDGAGEGGEFRTCLQFAVHVQVGDGGFAGSERLAGHGCQLLAVEGAAVVGVAVPVDEGLAFGDADAAIITDAITVRINGVGGVGPAEGNAAAFLFSIDAVGVSVGRHLAAVDVDSASEVCIDAVGGSIGRHLAAVDVH